MLIWTTAGLIRLATLMNTRERSAGEAIGACCTGGVSDIFFSIGVCWLETVEPSGDCWLKTIEPLDANKPNPSERASAGVSIRPRFALVIESLNLFSIFAFYLCVEK
jgi:hypothetical protein